MSISLKIGAAVSLCALLPAAALSAPFGPDPVKHSKLTVQIDKIGELNAGIDPDPNFASPVAIGPGMLLGVDQHGAIQKATEGGASVEIFNRMTDAPDGLLLTNRESVLNVAYDGDNGKLYVAFTADNLPNGFDPNDLRELPPALPGMVSGGFPNPFPLKQVDDMYRLTPEDLSGFPPFADWTPGLKNQVIYEYDFDGMTMSNPKALAAFEVQSSITGHHGGGMAVTPDGKILFATGDNLPFGQNGREGAQDENEHVSKVFLIDPSDSSVTLVAKGVRNPQQLVVAQFGGETVVGFADIGGVTAEEVNFVRLSDLEDTGFIENFGWGIAGDLPDGQGREGTFYVGPGIPGIFGTQPPYTGDAPIGEAGFIQPVAQYNRSNPGQFVAVSGSVVSEVSFDSITSLFGDLASGEIFASLSDLLSIDGMVFKVQVVGSDRLRTSINEIAGGRADPRFFVYGDGSAGVLFENTGEYFRLTETKPVPLPAPLLLLGAGVGLLGAFRLRKRG